jgi:hemolysin activation/secretion protein
MRPHPRTLERPAFSFRAGSVTIQRRVARLSQIGAGLAAVSGAILAQEPQVGTAQGQPTEPRRLFIREYRVIGAKQLPRSEVETAVYPYLGPGRSEADIDQARAALEKAYQDKGYQTVSVEVPAQSGRRGIVFLQVNETKIGRLRVKGSRYFSLEEIKKHAPSLQEGSVPNFNDVQRDIIALNQLPDRRITPELRAGSEPGTVDVNLVVKDTLPLHGSLELNNRYSADTTELRLSGSLSYANLWQLGHTIGGSFQVSPEDLDEVRVLSGFYIARFPQIDWLSLMFTAVKQESNVSTLGSVAVAGRGEVFGFRAIVTLPPRKDFYQTFSFGLDYKNFEDTTSFGIDSFDTPIEYYPISANYTATWTGKKYTTELNAGLTFSFRGVGSEGDEFENSRFRADGSFIYLRGDLSHTHTLPGDAELFVKVQGQLADQPLVNTEQFGGGGLGTVRGYLEAEVLGDNAAIGTIELRSPSLLGWIPGDANEWRVYAFVDGGVLTINKPLPEQESHFELATIGVGSRIKLLDYVNGSVDAALPLISQTQTTARDLFLSFRVWAEF